MGEAYRTAAGAYAVAGKAARVCQVIHSPGADAKLGGNVGGFQQFMAPNVARYRRAGDSAVTEMKWLQMGGCTAALPMFAA